MTSTGKFLALLGAFSFVFCASVVESHAATINAASASYSNVASAVSNASCGDTVVVPAGSATWISELEITKYITLQGAGIGQTVITSNIGNVYSALIKYEPDAASRSANGLFRVMGFTFDGNGYSSGGVYIYNWTTDLIDQVRIDHNRFVECKWQGVEFEGFAHGLVNKNEFHNCYKSCDVQGKYWDSWEQIPLDLSSKNAVYIEDNQFTFTNDCTDCSGITSGGHGGRYVFRYNTIDNPQAYDILDAHGNQKPVTEEYRNDHRGSVFVEIYNNIITNTHLTSQRVIILRGGTCIVFGNRVTGTSSSAKIEFWEEDGWRFHYLSEYPGYDPIKDTYIWDNTYNGSTIIPILGYPEDAIFIQLGRDYWLEAKPGYVPFQYPHPLSRPSAPRNLHFVELRLMLMLFVCVKEEGIQEKL